MFFSIYRQEALSAENHQQLTDLREKSIRLKVCSSVETQYNNQFGVLCHLEIP